MKCCYCGGDIPNNAMQIHLTECEVLQQRLRAAKSPPEEISDTDRLNWLLSHLGAEVECRDNQSDVFYVKTTKEDIDKWMKNN